MTTSKTRKKATVYSHGLIKEPTQVIGKTVNNMEKVHISTMTVLLEKESGKMEKESSGPIPKKTMNDL